MPEPRSNTEMLLINALLNATGDQVNYRSDLIDQRSAAQEYNNRKLVTIQTRLIEALDRRIENSTEALEQAGVKNIDDVTNPGKLRPRLTSEMFKPTAEPSSNVVSLRPISDSQI